TRSTSFWLTSWCLPRTPTAPRLLMPRTWPPLTPVITEATSAPDIASASATACLIDSTVESRLTMTPLRRPRDELAPTPTTSRVPRGDHSAMTQQPWVVPMSTPAMTCRPFALGMISPSLHSGRPEDDLATEAQIDGDRRFAGRCRLREDALQA